MSLAQVFVFASAMFVAAASPGPGVAALVARVLGRGPRGAIAFTVGLAIGDTVWLACAVLGLSALALRFEGVFVAIKYAGAAYLLFMAWKLWTAPVEGGRIAPIEGESPLRLFVGGLSVTLSNPKVMVFYLALLPSLIDIAHVTPTGFAELALIALGILTVVFGAYIVLASRARALLSDAGAVRALNRGTGLVMAGAAIAVATR